MRRLAIALSRLQAAARVIVTTSSIVWEAELLEIGGAVVAHASLTQQR
jgi:hypothetical protein